MKHMITLIMAATMLIMVSCSKQQQHTFKTIVMAPMTPVKDQGRHEICWAYAMLATIESEHILMGDSVNLSGAYIARMLAQEQKSNNSWKGGERSMCQTLLNKMPTWGIVPYDVLPDDATEDMPLPKWVFMLGARYSPKEFAHSLCAPDEYLSLTCQPDSPYYKRIIVDIPDNWEQNRLTNIPMDSLRRLVNHALKQRHAVCWESRGHAMEVVGMARDEQGRPYYIMKNSWGTSKTADGLVYMPAGRMWRDMVAVYLTASALPQSR